MSGEGAAAAAAGGGGGGGGARTGEKRKWEERSAGGGFGNNGGRGRGGRGGGERDRRGGGRGGRGGGRGGGASSNPNHQPLGAPTGARTPSGPGGDRDRARGSGCFKCGKDGHRSFECTEGGGGGGGDRARNSGCFKCGKEGHRSFECTEAGSSSRGGRGGGSMGRPFRAALPPEPSAEQIKLNLAASKMDLTTVRAGCEAVTSEQQVGIRQFLHPSEPFHGIFKSRTFDFMVHEIAPDGTVCHLKDTTVPREVRADNSVSAPPSPEGEAALRAILAPETVDQFLAFCAEQAAIVDAWYEQHPRPKKPQGGEFIIHVAMSKAERTAIHDAIRIHYPHLISDAVNADYVPPTAAATVTVTGEPTAAAVGDAAAVVAPYVSAASMIVDMPVAEHASKKAKMDEEAAAAAKAAKAAADAAAAAAAAAAGTTPAAAVPAVPLPDRKLRIRFAVLTAKNERDTRVNAWPRTRPDYLRFTLYKENLGTMEALQAIALQLRLNLKLFGFAGTKDKRAVTAQHCTAYRVSADKFRHLQSQGLGQHAVVKVGDFDYVPSPLRLGELVGNEFRLIVRNVTGVEQPALQVLLENIARRGFVNYYGMQRFGSNAIPTHLIGRALLRGDYCEALSLVLIPRVGERGDIRSAREYFARTRDLPGSIARMPHFMRTEAEILRVLQAQGVNAFANAIDAVPRAMRLMYVHAYQSFVWNHLVSERVAMEPRNVILGDLVIDREAAAKDRKAAGTAEADPAAEEAAAAPDADAADAAAAAPVEGDDADEPEPEPALTDALEVDAASADERTYTTSDVHVVSAADLASSKYTLSDVVVPLPGYDVIYPSNEIGAKALAMLEADGVKLEKYTKGKNKDFCLSGAYRKMVQVPFKMQWEFLRYSQPYEPLSGPTDWQRIKEARDAARGATNATGTDATGADDKTKQADGAAPMEDAAPAAAAKAAPAPVVKMEESATAAATAAPAASSTALPPVRPAAAAPADDGPSNHLFGLQLVFQLASSTYATMLLRELMKSDTTTETQRGRAQEHQRTEEARGKENAAAAASASPDADATMEPAASAEPAVKVEPAEGAAAAAVVAAEAAAAAPAAADVKMEGADETPVVKAEPVAQ